MRPAFIFDIDGTLLNTLGDIGGACNVILAQYGFPVLPVEEYARFLGGGFRKMLRQALGPRAPGQSALEKMATEAFLHYQEHAMNATKPYPGIVDMLEALVDRGHQLAVYSDKPDFMAQPLIVKYFPHVPFTQVAGARENWPRKPNPQALLDIMAKLGVPGQATFYVGDSAVDMETAIAAGARSIGAAWGYCGRNILEAANANFIAENPTQILLVASPRGKA